jgi:hypothetical protein
MGGPLLLRCRLVMACPHHHPRVIDRPKAVTTSTTDPAGASLETKNFTRFHFL